MNNRLKLLRKNLGLTQAEFAKKLGISQNFLSSIERGERKISSELCLSLIELNVNLNWLIADKGSMFCSSTVPDLDSLSEEVLSLLNSLPEDRKKAVLNYVRDQKKLAELS